MIDVKKITTAATHPYPHLDELLVIFLLKLAQRMLKIRRKLELILTDNPTPFKAREDVLLIGIGGGPLDEHSTVDHDGKHGECAATLAVKEFGLEQNEQLQFLLNYVLRNDQRAQGGPGDFHSVLRAMYERHAKHPLVAVKYGLQGIDAMYFEQIRFLKAAEQFRTQSDVLVVPRITGDVKIAILHTDNDRAAACARKIGYAVLIQVNTSGNVQIHTDMRANLPSLAGAARILRILEQAKKERLVTSDSTTLARYGSVPGAEEWFFPDYDGQLLNGSKSTSKPPTRLTPTQIRNALVYGMRDELHSIDEVLERFGMKRPN